MHSRSFAGTHLSKADSTYSRFEQRLLFFRGLFKNVRFKFLLGTIEANYCSDVSPKIFFKLYFKIYFVEILFLAKVTGNKQNYFYILGGDIKFTVRKKMVSNNT
jgi:hypothetical protein